MLVAPGRIYRTGRNCSKVSPLDSAKEPGFRGPGVPWAQAKNKTKQTDPKCTFGGDVRACVCVCVCVCVCTFACRKALLMLSWDLVTTGWRQQLSRDWGNVTLISGWPLLFGFRCKIKSGATLPNSWCRKPRALSCSAPSLVSGLSSPSSK